MRLIGIVAVMALLAGPALAQSKNMQKYGDPDKVKSPTEIAAEKEAERAYQRSLGNIPEQKSTDPWGTVRSDNTAPKAVAKTPAKTPAKPKAAKSEAKSEAAAKQ
ncbi:MAG: hypothetical protein J0H42_22370 [Rhizobiales bacterium]|nr:hypothetical protein [Hyphomicrobiales bacterium]